MDFAKNDFIDGIPEIFAKIKTKFGIFRFLGYLILEKPP